MISAIVLAAGTSSRMGRSKPLLRLAGRPLLENVLDAVRRSRVNEIVVVLGHEAGRVRAEIDLNGARVVVNEDYSTGMSSSIRIGLRAVDPKADAYFVVLGDQPFVSPATLDALIDRRATSAAKILVPTFLGTRGNPVLLDRAVSGEVTAISGDRGCRAIFANHPDDLLEVPVSDPGILVDLDTESQLSRARMVAEGGASLESLALDLASRRVHAHESDAPAETLPPVRPQVDVLALAQHLRSRDEPFALATVVRAVRPTSGKPGNKAVVRQSGELVGWVGGSCAESVVIAESLAALRDGRPRLLRLSRNPDKSREEEGVVEYLMECHSGGAMDIYVEPHQRMPRLLIVGDSPVAETLSALGRLLGYRVVFAAPGANREALAEADDVITSVDRLEDVVTPDTYAVVATMGKYDETALRTLAASHAPYVALVASRTRSGVLLDALRRHGIPAKAVDRVRTPAGLDIAAKTPEEIALSIMAEITQVRRTTAPEELPVVTTTPASLSTDVVCGMEVDPSTALRAEHEGRVYHFCSEGCRERFLATPEAFAG